MPTDKMKIEVLEDGTIKTTTDPISGSNHQNAEEFLRSMANLAGGETIRVRRSGAHHHQHQHEDERAHQH